MKVELEFHEWILFWEYLAEDMTNVFQNEIETHLKTHWNDVYLTRNNMLLMILKEKNDSFRKDVQ